MKNCSIPHIIILALALTIATAGNAQALVCAAEYVCTENFEVRKDVAQDDDCYSFYLEQCRALKAKSDLASCENDINEYSNFTAQLLNEVEELQEENKKMKKKNARIRMRLKRKLSN